MDLLPTFARMAGTYAPRDRKTDGRDIRKLILREPGDPVALRRVLLRRLNDQNQLHAVRSGR